MLSLWERTPQLSPLKGSPVRSDRVEKKRLPHSLRERCGGEPSACACRNLDTIFPCGGSTL